MDYFLKFINNLKINNFITKDKASDFFEYCFIHTPYEKVLLYTEIFVVLCIIILSLFLTLFVGKKLKFLIFLIGCLGLGYFFYYQTTPETIKYDIDMGLKEPIKIVQMSDFHYNTTFPYSYNLAIKSCNKEKPDIVCLTGDYVTNFSESNKIPTSIPKDFFLTLRKIHCDKIYAVYGNHDNLKDKKIAEEKFNDSGVEIIDNKIIKLPNDLYICGAEYYGLSNKKVYKILEKLPKNSKAVILTHNPACLYCKWNKLKLTNLKDKDIIFLTGHTHGGQIICKKSEKEKIAKKFFYTDILNGMTKKYNSNVYISKGTGTSHLPFRLNAKPEITVFNIK